MRLPFMRKRRNTNSDDDLAKDGHQEGAKETYDEENDEDIYYDARPNYRRLTKVLAMTNGQNRVDARIKRNDASSGPKGSKASKLGNDSNAVPGAKSKKSTADDLDGDIPEELIAGDYQDQGSNIKISLILDRKKLRLANVKSFWERLKRWLQKLDKRMDKAVDKGLTAISKGSDKIKKTGKRIVEHCNSAICKKTSSKSGFGLGHKGGDYSGDEDKPTKFDNLPREAVATVGPVIPTNLGPIPGFHYKSDTTDSPLFWVPFATFGGILLLVLLLICFFCFCFKKKAGELTPDKSSSTNSLGLKNQMLTVEVPSDKSQDVSVQKVNGENVMVIKECNPNSSEPTVTTISESAPDSKGIVNVTIVKETMVKVPHKEPSEKTVVRSKSNLGPGLVRLSQSQLSNARSKLDSSNTAYTKGSKSRL